METAAVSTAAKLREVALGPYEILIDKRHADGAYLMRPAEALRPYHRCVTQPLRSWAEATPERTFLAKRGADGQWRRLSYRQALDAVRRISQALLDRKDLSPERPVMVISGNDIEHALIGLAAMHVGLPYVPVSPSYALLSGDYQKLRHTVKLTTPGLVFANDARRFSKAIQAAFPGDTEVVATEGEVTHQPTTPFAALLEAQPTSAVDTAFAAITGDTIAKFLFTSGSTKLPKAVINTHGMLCANLQQYIQCYPFLAERPPVLVDWLPWHHTAGGNLNLNVALFRGGTFYIDDGKPVAELFGETIRNLREISPHTYCTVPKGLEELARAMRTDRQLRDSFFAELKSIFPGGAGLSESVRAELNQASVDAYGERVLLNSGLGMTETAPFAMTAHVTDWQVGELGIPAPGMEVKLAPVAGKLEVRYRGPNVTPGYWRDPEQTRRAFDDEGFFCSGDAARFIEPAHPERGLTFDGRLAEDFKLATGTFVSVGELRARLLAAGAPLIQDAVIAGQDRDEVTALIFLHLPSCREFVPQTPNPVTLADAAGSPEVRRHIQKALDAVASRSTGSSSRIARALLVVDAPSFDLGEVTDKGTINQRMVLNVRAQLVEQLYSMPVPPQILIAAS